MGVNSCNGTDGVIQKVKIHRYIPWAFSRAGVCHPHNRHQICKSAKFPVPILVSKPFSPFPSPVCLWWTRRWWTTFLWSWGWKDTLKHCATSCWWRMASLHSPSAICSLKRWSSWRGVAVISIHIQNTVMYVVFYVVYWIQMSSSLFQWNIISSALVLVKTSLWPAILPEFLSCLICSDIL